MPYKESPYFETPDRTKPLWRYMHIDKFMSMINTYSLYFPKITVFQDIYEGVLTKLSREEVYKTNLLDKTNTPVKQDRKFTQQKDYMDSQSERGDYTQTLEELHSFETVLHEFSNHLMFCSCWFQNDYESHSMWAEYGDKSPTAVAIQTTVGALIDSLEATEYNVHIGQVNYKDYETEHVEGYENFSSIDLKIPNNVLKLFYAPITHKRKLYADEHEVRVVISFESICEKHADRIYTSEIPFYSDNLFEKDFFFIDHDNTNDMKNIPDPGMTIDVDLTKLIKNVVMSPYRNGYFDEALVKLMFDNDLNGELVRYSRINEVVQRVSSNE